MAVSANSAFNTVLPNDPNRNQGMQLWLQGLRRIAYAITLSGPTTARPTENLWIGQPFFDTTLEQTVVWNGTTWASFDLSVQGGVYIEVDGNSINFHIPQTPAEAAAGVFPTLGFTQYYPGNLLRYGADPTGLTDSTQAIQNAIYVSSNGGGAVFAPDGNYLHTGSLTWLSDVNCSGDDATFTYIGTLQQITTPKTGALIYASITGIDLVAANATKILELYSPYKCKFSEINYFPANNQTIVIDILTNSIGTPNPDGEFDAKFNEFHSPLITGTCGEALRMTGQPAANVTLNDIYNLEMISGGANTTGIDFAQWAHTNHFIGVTRVQLQNVANALGVGVYYNSANTGNDVGVFCNVIDHLRVDAPGTPAGDQRTGFLMTTTKDNMISFYQNEPQCANGAYYFGAGISNTVLLLHFDGANGSTSTTDSSIYNNPISFSNVGGQVYISTAQMEFGNASLFINSTNTTDNAYITTPMAPGGVLDITKGDFTIEGWILFPGNFQVTECAIGGNFTPFNTIEYITLVFGSNRPNPGSGQFQAEPSNSLQSGGQWVAAGFSGGLNFTAGVMHHWAVTKHGANGVCFFDGTPSTNAINWGSSTIWNLANDAHFIIGWDSNESGGTSPVYFDEIRITKGVALYTTAFTPPTAPFTGGVQSYTTPNYYVNHVLGTSNTNMILRQKNWFVGGNDNPFLYVGAPETNTACTGIYVGSGRTGNISSFIKLVGDTTYTDYGVQVERDSTGANADSRVDHRGSGNLVLSTVDAGANIVHEHSGSNVFWTNNTGANATNFGVYANGNVVIGGIANLNFNNSATVSVNVTSNGVNQTNISFTVNRFGSGIAGATELATFAEAFALQALANSGGGGSMNARQILYFSGA
jgi:Pectate lyase superfamily protein